MEKDRFSAGGSCERPPLLCSRKRSGAVREEGEPDAEESREEMIRALQGIFCKGRYRSWELRKPDEEKAEKENKKKRKK